MLVSFWYALHQFNPLVECECLSLSLSYSQHKLILYLSPFVSSFGESSSSSTTENSCETQNKSWARRIALPLSLSLSHTHSLANTKHYQTRQMLMLLLRALTHSSNTSFTCVCVYHACVLCIVRGRERGKDGMVWGGVYLLGVNPTTRHVNAEMAILPSPFFFNPTPDIIFSLFCILHLYFVRLWPDPFKEKEESLHFKSSPAANKIVKIWFWFRSGTLLPTQEQEGGGKNDSWLLVKREKWYFEKFCERTKNKVRASEVTLKIWKLSNHLNSVSRSVSD